MNIKVYCKINTTIKWEKTLKKNKVIMEIFINCSLFNTNKVVSLYEPAHCNSSLTRGYPDDKSQYQTLIKRNSSIQRSIIQHRDNTVDIILFHEGNISKFDQEYINSKSQIKIKSLLMFQSIFMMRD